MSNDDWQRNQNPNNNQGPSPLPGPGESWDDAHDPRPLHQVPDSDWGTAAPPQNAHPPQYQQPQNAQHPGAPHPGYQQGNPQPGHQPQSKGAGRRKPGSMNDPYGGGPMVHQPPYQMQRGTTEMDGTDIGAIIISAFFPGVGHMMLGQVTKGIVILAATYLTCGLGYIAAALICIDAYMVAKARKVRPVDEWEFLPKP